MTHSALDLASGAVEDFDIVLAEGSSDLSGSVHGDGNQPLTFSDRNGDCTFKSLPPANITSREDADAQQLLNGNLLAMFSAEDSKVKPVERSRV